MTLCLELFQHHLPNSTEIFLKYNVLIQIQCPLSLSLQLQGALAVLLCNVKACKVRGVVSMARLLCCSTSDDVNEMLVPPTGSAPGDRVTFNNFPGNHKNN